MSLLQARVLRWVLSAKGLHALTGLAKNGILTYQSAIAGKLVAAGIRADRIMVSPVCTFQQVAIYFSARRLGINSGRIFTGIMLR